MKDYKVAYLGLAYNNEQYICKNENNGSKYSVYFCRYKVVS